MKVVVEVTQEDVNQGERRSSNQCMVARAFRRSTEGAWHDVLVDPQSIHLYTRPWLSNPRAHATVPLPRRVGQKIRRWDAGIQVRPFSFELDLPVPGIDG